jgi:hypothetical protein
MMSKHVLDVVWKPFYGYRADVQMEAAAFVRNRRVGYKAMQLCRSDLS